MRVHSLVSSWDEPEADRHGLQMFISCVQDEVGCRIGLLTGSKES